jgi:hypothetical protein
MRHLAVGIAPVLFEGTGPGCVTDGCPEGKMTCGDEYSGEEIAAMDLTSVAVPGILFASHPG